MTDEELRKKYGIHMAARLHTEDGKGNRNNWADEEDDEEWMPDTISWADGTKTAIPQPDENPAPAPAPTPVAAVSAPPAKNKPISSNTPSPVVKPSVLAHGKGGLILKGGGHDKPALVAKPPQPPITKSPWAPLPPIEKASILPVEPLESKHSKERHQPLKEIAADDFSRAWRDGNNKPRELYNSQSGRYEPAGGDRRTFQRNEPQAARYPSVLQRPATTVHETEGPAEPSAAFQTSRTSSQEGPYGRRRGSSNVSGGSGLMHRMSKDFSGMPPPMHGLEPGGGRRGSFAGGSDSVDFSRNHSSPRVHQVQPWQQKTSPRMPSASPLQQHAILESQPGIQAPAGEQASGLGANHSQNDIEYQQRVMRERRELAKKRRMEQEAKEEAEKRERLRRKLEAMGPAPERHSVRKEKEREAAAKAAEEAATKEPSTAKEGSTTDVEGAEQIEEAAPNLTRQEPVQITIQRKEQPQPTKEASVSAPKSALISDLNKTPPARASQPMITTPLRDGTGPSHPSMHDGESQNDKNISKHFQNSTRLLGHEEKRPGWSHQPPPAGWGPSPSNRIWGSPNNDRTLGNGTFTSDLARVPDALPRSAPGPIAPPSLIRSQEPPISRLPPPIAPPRPSQQKLVSNDPSCKTDSLVAWRNTKISEQDRTDTGERQRHWDENTRKAENIKKIENQGMALEQTQSQVQGTWKAVTVHENDTRNTHMTESITIGKKEEKVNGAGTWDPHLGVREQTQKSISTSIHQPPSRGSRFFPTGKKDELPVISAESESMRTRSPSPPPPTMFGHPAYDGDTRRPHVSLPPQRPVVKLPPSSTASSSSIILTRKSKTNHPVSTYAAAATSYQPSPHDHRQVQRPTEIPPHENWEAKINNLFGKKTTTRPVVVDSASKRALDHYAPQASATVSLPTAIPQVKIAISADETSYTTKVMDEECFEEQEMGSLPAVHLPRTAPDVALLPLPSNLRPPRGYRLLMSTSREEYQFEPEAFRRVFLPNMKEPKRVTLIYQPGPMRSARGRGGGSRAPGNGTRRGGRNYRSNTRIT